MSTRGYLTIVDSKKNIQAAAYYPSDSYPSHFGLMVLDAIEQNNLPQLIDKLHQEYPEELDMVDGICRDWYVRSPQNKDDYFVDYGYEFNPKRQELNLFHFGNKALTIPYDRIPLYRSLFEQEDSLYYRLCLDERTMTLKKDFYKEIRSMIKSGADIADFQAVIEQNPSILYLNTGRIKDIWSTASESFNKEVRDTAGGKLSFHIHESFGKFYLYVQTPFVRAPLQLHQQIRSASAAEKLLAELVRTRQDDIRVTMKVFQELEQYKKEIHSIYHNDNQPLLDRAADAQSAKLKALNTLKQAQKHHRIVGNTTGLLERQVNETNSNQYRHAKERLEPQTSSFSDTLSDAAHRAESVTNQTKEPIDHER